VRRLIVCNFVTVDGYYEANDKTIDGLFEHQHPDYAGDDSFDHDLAPWTNTRWGRPQHEPSQLGFGSVQVA
jgi:hypothetical protein